MNGRVNLMGDPGTECAIEWIGWRTRGRWLFHKVFPHKKTERQRRTAAGTRLLERRIEFFLQGSPAQLPPGGPADLSFSVLSTSCYQILVFPSRFTCSLAWADQVESSEPADSINR